MDEQTIQQSTASMDTEDYSDSEGTSAPIAEEVTDAPLADGETSEPEVSIDETGNVKFNDEFFGDMLKDDEEEPEEPNYYSDEELESTPYEEWDTERLSPEARRYASVVQSQIQRRRAEEAQQEFLDNQSPPDFMTAPREYTPKELAEESKKLAMEKLGIQDEDDFDEYEGEHVAAREMAMQELLYKNYAERANYQRGISEYQELQKFNVELSRRPDFVEFQKWFAGKLQAKGLTANQVEAGLRRYAQDSGYNFRGVQGVIGNWYREFQNERSSRPRAKKPPVLEGSRGGSYEGRRMVDLREFGEMDAEHQAQALMKMGIV